jgi:hypothetical protein
VHGFAVQLLSNPLSCKTPLVSPRADIGESMACGRFCTRTHKGGDKTFDTWEEGSQLKEYPYKITGGTGKYQGASGGGTYIYENLTETLSGGTYKGTMELP